MRRKVNKKERNQENLTKRLAGYSLTAGLVIAAGGKAQAGIIYSGSMNEPFGTDYGDYNLTMEGLNPEARFWGEVSTNSTITNSTMFTSSVSLRVTRMNNNFRVNAGSMYSSIYNLPVSSNVGSTVNTPLRSNALFYSATLVFCHGSWKQDGQSGYFGFSFDLENESAGGAAAGTTVYGWGLVERIDISNGRLLGWAYEDSGGAIHVGDTGAGTSAIPVPSALGLAALGAAGVLSMRRRKKD